MLHVSIETVIDAFRFDIFIEAEWSMDDVEETEWQTARFEILENTKQWTAYTNANVKDRLRRHRNDVNSGHKALHIEQRQRLLCTVYDVQFPYNMNDYMTPT